MSLAAVILTIGIIWAVAYHRVPLRWWSGVVLLLLILHTWLVYKNMDAGALRWMGVSILWLLFIVIIVPLNMIPLRRKYFSERLFHWYQGVMPKMSSTEKEALEAGNVSFEAELFSGKPRWMKLAKIPPAKLTTEEQAFIDGPVEKLCEMINDWHITHVDADMPPEMWQFLKSEGFFGLIIPKEYGGKAFSAFAHSEILSKVYGVSVTVASTIAVPNSLGPAELLLHYGTDEQRNYYLPRLACGEEIPCFALTNPEAGSDAGSIPDTGIICRGQFNGEEIIGIRLNWNKRYITLAPVASVLGLAFKLYDPEHLMGNQVDWGITCALIPVHTAGITIGRRHCPLNVAFQNGPTQGKDVFIPLDWIIGGFKMAGQGWRMLVESLSVGRAISLPSSAMGGVKMASLATGAYARIRRQFGMPIGRFEGVAEALTRIAGATYFMDAARRLTLSIIDHGGRPSVLSAIMKYHATELARKTSIDAMDVHGGKGICLGAKNYLGRYYQTAPIGITVEGANILTRSMIIFGQGAIRCHRYVLAELLAAQDVNKKRGLSLFDKALFGHAGLIISNVCRALFLGLTNGWLVTKPAFAGSAVRRYYQLLTRTSSAFATLADFSLMVLGGDLKRRERLSARLGDILSLMYMISATLKRYEDEGRQTEDLPLVSWVCETAFCEIQQQMSGVIQNFPHKFIRGLLRVIVLPLGNFVSPPADRLSQQVAEILLSPSATRERLIHGVFKGNLMAELETALQQVIRAELVEAKIHKAVREKILILQDLPELTAMAVKAEIITQEEAHQVLLADKLRKEIIAVDDFAPEELTHGSQ